VLRLPHAVKEVFNAWLDTHAASKKDRILARLRELRGGALYDSRFGARMKGEGVFAEQLRRLFEVTCRRTGLSPEWHRPSAAHFRRPGGTQLELL
jgi:DNA repair photolyase